MDYTAPLTQLPKAPRRPFRWVKPLIIGLAVTLVVTLVLASVARYSFLLASRTRTAKIIARLDEVDPGWRFEQIEAAREVFPADVISAVPTLAANRLIPSKWPQILANRQPGNPGPMVAQQDTVIAPLYETDTLPRLTELQITALRAELAALTPALTEARKVADKSKGRHTVAWALNPLKTLLPHAQDSRNTVRMLKLDAILRVHDGDADGALASCRAAMNVGRSLGDEPIMITQLVRIAIEKVALRAIEHVLSQGEPSEEALAAVQGLIEDEEVQPLLRIAARGERAALNDLYARLASGEIKGLGEKDEETPPIIQWLWGEAMCIHARGAVLEEMGEAIAIADAPLSQQVKLTELWNQGVSRRASEGPMQKFDRLLLPAMSAFVEVYVASRTQLRTALVAIAARRYRLKHGRWPESAEQLSPWPLSKVPSDPHTDEPLLWLRSDDSLVIYSPGPDLVDNDGFLDQESRVSLGEAGKPRRNRPYWEDKDIGFRLWDDPRPRQQPSTEDERPPGSTSPP